MPPRGRALLVLCLLGLLGLGGGGRALARGASLTARASLGTLSGSRTVEVRGTGFSPRAAVVIAECGKGALAEAARGATTSALDYCDESRVAVVGANGSGQFSARTYLEPVMQAPSGPIDCRPTGACLLGALNLDVLQGGSLQVAILPLRFTASARDPAAPTPSRVGVRAGRRGVPSVSVGHPWHGVLTARPARGLGAGRTGTVPQLPTAALPSRPMRGEGLVALTMSAPGTSWGDPEDTSVVVEVRLDRRPWQQIVLFAGASPFTYEGFTGPLVTGPHRVEVRLRPDLSHVRRHPPVARIVRRTLAVVPPGTPLAEELAHAPVMYDRRVSSTADTPLITYATDAPEPGGLHRLTYVVTWSRESAGTGFVPWLEWGTWGRMTDIETAITLEVGRHGTVGHAVYLGCVTCGADFPENRTALDETERPFAGRWYFGHPVLRVATGNNDFSDVGTTPLRFQPALAAPPAPGATREGAMDRNPWTYAIMGRELARARGDYSTAPGATGPGDPRQYLIVQLDTAVHGASAVGVDLRLAGDPRTYTNDLDTTYPLYDGGIGRTVVKVPLGRADRAITLLRLRVLSQAPGVAARLTVHHIAVLEFTGRRIVGRRLPRIAIAVEPAPAAVRTAPAITAS